MMLCGNAVRTLILERLKHLNKIENKIASFQGYAHILLCVLLIGVEGVTTNAKSSALPSEHLIPPPLVEPIQRYGQINERPTIFQRIAGWFGFGGQNTHTEIQSNASPIMINEQTIEAEQNTIQERYSDLSAPDVHQSVQQPQDHAHQKQKGGCNPCNKVPWMPMFGGQQQVTSIGIKKQSLSSTQYKQPQFHHLQYQQPPPFQYTNAKVQSFNFHRKNPQHVSNLQHLTLPTYTPPLLHSTTHSVQANSITSPEYQPPRTLLPIQQTQHHLIPIPLPNLSVTPIPPLYDAKPFSHNILHSNGVSIQSDTIPVQSKTVAIPIEQNPIYIQRVPQINDQLNYGEAVTPSSEIEIQKSVSLGDFTSTIEYPHNIVQSPVIEFSGNSKSLSKVQFSQPEHLSEPIVVDSIERDSEDNLSSASSKNFTIENRPKQEIITSDPMRFNTSSLLEITTQRPNPFKIVDLQGRTKTNVEVETSVQTINDKATSILKMNRETPKDLLDSPIYYLKKTSLPPTTNLYTDVTKITEPRTTNLVIDNSSWSPSTHKGTYTTVAYAIGSSTTSSPVTATIIPEDSNVANSGISAVIFDKKPKQIQIIIPYTNKNQPRPFRANKFQIFDTSSGWSHQTQSNDYQDSQESQMVTATVTQAPMKKNTKYLTKILASNLRDLLRKEKSNFTSIELWKLQNKIDGWTEQEFSMVPNKVSTISFRGQSKNIPSEYLTTTTPIQQFPTTTDMIATTSLEPLYADEEYKKADYFGKMFEENKLSFDGGKLTTIIPMPFQLNKLSETHELWNKLNVDISPVTKEKVYVVTPQPWKEYNQNESDLFGTFKSPRFSVRPTPGIATTSTLKQKQTLPKSVMSLQNEDKKQTKITPSWIVSSFNPSTQEENIDGHSRVLTVVTPPAYDWKIVA
ncbi:hypothetical protein Bhyg_13110 [Pseudolycoriella hygida]|uniref:Uncharacterized protein n=1 Tax=Pseudolycoriella hygida TaxID=35572 RepID=A0A9Q0MYN0_9DIPT|nr:hypothetical protein Bhyg_13110 [Pseudolycoriella hygida]